MSELAIQHEASIFQAESCSRLFRGNQMVICWICVCRSFSGADVPAGEGAGARAK
jgi:hypothetical protein